MVELAPNSRNNVKDEPSIRRYFGSSIPIPCGASDTLISIPFDQVLSETCESQIIMFGSRTLSVGQVQIYDKQSGLLSFDCVLKLGVARYLNARCDTYCDTYWYKKKKIKSLIKSRYVSREKYRDISMHRCIVPPLTKAHVSSI